MTLMLPSVPISHPRIVFFSHVVATMIAATQLPAAGVHAQCQTGQIVDPDASPGGFGAGPVLLGDRAIIGVSEYGGINKVYLFREQQMRWTLEQTLIDPQLDSKSGFGSAAALEGDQLIVGAYGASGRTGSTGAAFVFDLRDEPPSLQAIISADDGDFGELFGWSVAMDGDELVIGAPDAEAGTVSGAGAAYVLERDRTHGTWVQRQKLTAPEPQTQAFMGCSVAIEGNLIAVGALWTSAGRGAVHLFRKRAGSWEFEQTLTAPDATLDIRFGQSVALLGDCILAGAPIANTPIGPHRGAAYVFRYDGSRWIHEQKLFAAHPAGVSPFFGSSVSLTVDNDRLAAVIGAENGGPAYVFQNSQSVWKEIATLTPSGEQLTFWFHSRVACDGDRALITAGDGVGNGGYLFIGVTSPDCNDNGQADACDLLAGTSRDLDGNRIPDECESPADLNGDLAVDSADLGLLLAAWGKCSSPCPADLDGNGEVDAIDLGFLLASWDLR